jgi:hypothetical protein
MEVDKFDSSAAKQKIAKLSMTDSFEEVPLTSACSSVMPEDFERPYIGEAPKPSSTHVVKELSRALKQLHAVLVDYFPAAQLSTPPECQSLDDLSAISLSLNSYVVNLKESLRKASGTSYRLALDSARVDLDVHVYRPEASKLSVLDKVFSRQAVSFDAEETQALASVVIGAIRDSASEDLKKRIAILQNNYVKHSEDLLQLRRVLRKKEDSLQELTQRLKSQVQE